MVIILIRKCVCQCVNTQLKRMVTECPSTAELWALAEKQSNCSEIAHTCTERPPRYHCVIHENQQVFAEGCFREWNSQGKIHFLRNKTLFYYYGLLFAMDDLSIIVLVNIILTAGHEILSLEEFYRALVSR